MKMYPIALQFCWMLTSTLGLTVFFGVRTVRATPLEEIGSSLCYCAPNKFEFTLDFGLVCPPVNIPLGDAVAATTCVISPIRSFDVEDLVPVAVTSVDVIELNQMFRVIAEETVSPNNPYLDGDTFSYIPYAATPGEIVEPDDIPRGIQLNIVGVNKDGEEIIVVYLITYTNRCDGSAYPVLRKGNSIGWTRFSILAPPDQSLCPAVSRVMNTTNSNTVPIDTVDTSGDEESNVPDMDVSSFSEDSDSKLSGATAGSAVRASISLAMVAWLLV